MTAGSGAIAQLGERLNGIQEVVGSIPIGSTSFHLTFSDSQALVQSVVIERGCSGTPRDAFSTDTKTIRFLENNYARGEPAFVKARAIREFSQMPGWRTLKRFRKGARFRISAALDGNSTRSLSSQRKRRFAERLHKSIAQPLLPPASDHYRVLQNTYEALFKTVKEITGKDAPFTRWFGTGPVNLARCPETVRSIPLWYPALRAIYPFFEDSCCCGCMLREIHPWSHSN